MQYILDKLFWPTTSLLEAVGQKEPQIDALRKQLKHFMYQSLIPVEEYAQQYSIYVELINLDVKSYVE